MKKFYSAFATLLVIAIAFTILFISITQTAQVRYSFNGPRTAKSTQLLGKSSLDYYLPYPGRVLPDSPVWPVKALRDRMWIMITPKAQRKAELNLLFANKRLGAALILFEKDKPELAYSVLTKAENYLKKATGEALKIEEKQTKEKLLQDIQKASLKHLEVVEEILTLAPEDARPLIVNVKDFLFAHLTLVTREIEEK